MMLMLMMIRIIIIIIITLLIPKGEYEVTLFITVYFHQCHVRLSTFGFKQSLL